MIEIISTEFKDLKDLINASKMVSGTVVGYRYGEIRIYRDVAYIPISLGRGVWYILYTRNLSPIKDDTEALEFTANSEIKDIPADKFGEDPKSLYYLVIRPVKDDVINPLIE
jgi:hypothetical protein